jgi:chorismate synthase
VAAGAICRKLLSEFGVRVGGYVTEIGGVAADLAGLDLEARVGLALDSEMTCPSAEATAAMRARVQDIMQRKDTLGGVFEIVALGVPPGLGSHVHWDRRLTGRLAGALMSIHAMKGVEIGEAFANAKLPGTEVHDEIVRDAAGDLTRRSNRAGGLEGGITTGQPLVMRVAMKPISTTLTPLQSVDLATGEASPTDYERSDFCAVPRAVVVGEAMVCLVLADAVLEKLGGDSLDEMRPRFAGLRAAALEDLAMLGEGQVFWP